MERLKTHLTRLIESAIKGEMRFTMAVCEHRDGTGFVFVPFAMPADLDIALHNMSVAVSLARVRAGGGLMGVAFEGYAKATPPGVEQESEEADYRSIAETLAGERFDPDVSRAVFAILLAPLGQTWMGAGRISREDDGTAHVRWLELSEQNVEAGELIERLSYLRARRPNEPLVEQLATIYDAKFYGVDYD